MARSHRAILQDNEENLLFWPAAYKLHHAIRGGLLYHTLSIVKLASAVARLYPAVDRDLLLAGAILHDICKIDEFDVNGVGIVKNYSVKGELIGHLVMGAMEIERTTAKRSCRMASYSALYSCAYCTSDGPPSRMQRRSPLSL